MELSLKAFRVNSGLTIEEVAEKTGIEQSLIESWEEDTEKLKEAEVEDIMLLCDLYGIKAENIRI